MFEELRFVVGLVGKRVGYLDKPRPVLEGDPWPVRCHAAPRPDNVGAVVYRQGWRVFGRLQEIVLEAIHFVIVADIVGGKKEL